MFETILIKITEVVAVIGFTSFVAMSVIYFISMIKYLLDNNI
jgi:hypothetical protein